ncbi:hypothetical protein LMB33_05560 [Limosilactobacillus reuteri]|uniref:hypothetical protein n=1 Tax=Limosilactobacillus reuteri TaxID=1598 RepID=UPI001E3280A0|nr:hypothetical protein [Limosilactobacillus reuteri]MCC4326089.1 hypothetical protein [Limosilactobacillus reuteri]MCC4329839.1 hypothetical protein [Limosilactobacillus reuteri]
MSETFNKFKKMMELAKQNQKRFEKELKKLEYEDETSNGGEFPVGTLFTKDDLKDDDATLITQEELDEAEKNNKSLDEMNKENIDELNKVSISSVRSSGNSLRDISRSLREISKSLMNIEGYLTDNKEADWND